MKILQIYFFVLCLFLVGCSKRQSISPTIDNCQSILGAKILTEKERANACFYLRVFSYKDNIYTVCECCVCDKVYVAADCNGEDLFENSLERISDFQKNATYLFSVEGN